VGGQSSESSGRQSSTPGTLSPITATLISLFGGAPTASSGQFQPTAFAGPGAAFTPQSFAALPGLLANQPATATEQAFTSPGFQALGGQQALLSQQILGQGAAALPGLLGGGSEAAVAQARRGFTQETLPSILERAPGFSSSDLQRELSRAGVDLETNIAAMREQGDLARAGLITGQLPQFAQAVGTNLLDQAANVLGFGTVGREFLREVSPAGDAFRVLSALQSLVGGLTNAQFGTQESKSGGGGI